MGPAHPPAEVVIGLDVGTTATKAAAFGLGSSWRATVVREYPLLQPAPSEQVQDPDTLIAAVLGALADVVARARGAHVVAVSVSSAMHGLVGLDEDRHPLTPLLTWADSRATDEARGLRASGQAAELHRTSGTPVHPMSPLAKLLWFARHEPELSGRVRTWAGLKDLVLLALTGTLATELSSASGTGLLELATRTWSSSALDVAGIRDDQLPPVLSTTAALGLSSAVATRTGLRAGTPVVVGAGDGPLGNVGTGALARGVVGLSVGTSGAVRMVVPEPVVDASGRLFCYALTDRAWVVGGAISNGGIAARWAGSVFGPGSGGERTGDAELLALAASVPPGSDGLVALPYLLAERAPLWDPTLSGAFLGVRHAHTRGHFVRSVVEGVALQLSAIVADLDRLAPVVDVRATGGVFRSDVWRRAVAGAVDHPVRVTGGAEGSALGAAALALHALGRAPSVGLAVETLSPGLLAGSGEPIPVSCADRTAFARARTAVGELLASYAGVADVLAGDRSGWSTPTPREPLAGAQGAMSPARMA